MLRESGRVVAIEPGAVWVETIRSSACGRCAARAGCGHGALAGALGVGRGLIRVRESVQLAAGDCELNDTVEIELPESAVISASAMVYGLPLATAAASALLMTPLGELAAVGGFFAGLALGFGGVRWLTANAGRDQGFEPQLVGRAGADASDMIVRSSSP